MTTILDTATTTSAATATRAPYGRLLKVSVGATIVASVAAEAWVALMRATGIDLRVGDPFGDPIQVRLHELLPLPHGA